MHALVQPILLALSPRLNPLYLLMVRPSIPLEELLSVRLLQTLQTI